MVEVIRERRRQTILRLVGAGPGGSAVIAKRCRRSLADLERRVYEGILPWLPVSSPTYYGYLEDGDGFAWLFLEDVGHQRITLSDDVHRELAARWLGTLHSSAIDVVGPDDLPDRGPAHYRRVLGAGRTSIEERMDNPVLTPDQRRGLEKVLQALALVEGEWDAVEGFCRGLPATLVHGDFQPKNVLVRSEGRGARLFVIDWEFAGWGPVGQDLASSSGPALEPQVDLSTYASVARERWPESHEAPLREQVIVWSILRRVAAVEWAAQSLGFPNVLKPVSQLERYLPELREALANAPWR